MSGSKYQPLFDYLRRLDQQQVTLTLAEIEVILGDSLPGSAHHNKTWWSNRARGGVQAKAWMDAGFLTERVDIAAKQITFRKPPTHYIVERSGDTILWNADLIRALRRHTGWSQAELADRLGVYQQTVSDWEVGAHKPHRSISKLLTQVAEQATFTYGMEK